MAFKFIALATLLTVASAGVVPVAYHAAAPVAHLQYAHEAAPLAYAAPVAKVVDPEYDPNPEYKFAYNVHDTLTGDAKTQEETRHGDVVQGHYSLLEADGTKRVVHYVADPINGFNAVVEKQPAAVAIKTIAPVGHVYAAPVAQYKQLYH